MSVECLLLLKPIEQEHEAFKLLLLLANISETILLVILNSAKNYFNTSRDITIR